MVDLLHRATCCQFAEVDRGEARVLEQRDDVRFRVGEFSFCWDERRLLRREQVIAERVTYPEAGLQGCTWEP